jgi:D-alanyl-D-alanine carboxypeptidase
LRGDAGRFAEVRDDDRDRVQVWRVAAGVADVSTGRPVTPDMRHRVGSISKTFTATAVLQQADRRTLGCSAAGTGDGR